MGNFVDYKWLMDNLKNDKLIILDARAGLQDPEEGIKAYNEGHIKRAQFVSLEEVMTGEISTHGGRHPLPNIENFTEDMKDLGMKDDSTVVIYDNGNIAMAGRLWWLLRYFGKEDVFILEGGIKGWKDNNGQITTKIPKVEKSDSLNLKINKDMKIDMEHVKDIIDDDNSVIVDARSYERYIGEVEPMDKIPGHIPNAVNYPWTDLVRDGEILSIDKLKDKF